jgi:hypothetical protein
LAGQHPQFERAIAGERNGCDRGDGKITARAVGRREQRGLGVLPGKNNDEGALRRFRRRLEQHHGERNRDRQARQRKAAPPSNGRQTR